MLNTPSAYVHGYTKARVVDPEAAGNYIRHTTIGDPGLDPLMEELAELPPQDLHRFVRAGAQHDDKALRLAPRTFDSFYEPQQAQAVGSQWDLYGGVSPCTSRTSDSPIKVFSASEARHQFGRPIDTARAEPVVVEKHGCTVVVLAIKTFERPRGWTAAPSEKMDRDER